MSKYFLTTDEEAELMLKRRDLTIGVIGQGKMGLPLSTVFANSGYRVIGVDIDPEVVSLINKGEPPITGEPGVKEGIINAIEKGLYRCTLSLKEAVFKADILIIIIPTLVDKNRNPLLQPLIKLINSIGSHMEKGKIVIIESTVPPLTTEKRIKKQLEDISGFKAGVDFGLGFAPERTYSGRAIQDIVENYPKIVGGVDPRSTKRISMFYKSFVKKGVIEMSSATAAEAVKIFKGVYRDVNIALANELAKIAEKLEVNIYEIIKAANTEPYSHIHKPGAGVGGHCIPVYPHFLINAGKELGVETRLIETGREINLDMPNHVVKRVIQALNKINKCLMNKKICLLGLSYRGDVKEYRYSPTLDVIRELKNYKPNIVLHDPLFTEKELRDIIDIKFERDMIKAVSDSDCIVILTDHTKYKDLDVSFFDKYAKNPYAIIDTKHVLKHSEAEEINNRVIMGIGE